MWDFDSMLRKLKSSGLSIRGLVFFTLFYLVVARFNFSYLLEPNTTLYYVLYIVLGPVVIYLILRLIKWCVKLTGFDEIDIEDVNKVWRRK